jgi:hypothetical protein
MSEDGSILPFMTLAISLAEPSSWEFGWEALVAIGTLGLAFATAALALSTRNLSSRTAEEVEHSGQLVKESQRQVRATRKQVRASQQQVAGIQKQVEASYEQVEATRMQVEVSQEQVRTALEALEAAREQTRLAGLTLDAQIRPALVDVPLDMSFREPIFYSGRESPIDAHRGFVHVHLDAGREGALISVPMRNAGVGLAMIRGISLEVGTPIPTPPVTIQPANVPAGETSRVSFIAGPDHLAFDAIRETVAPGRQTFSVVVAYTDLAGGQMTLSRFDVHFKPEPPSNWYVRQVHLQQSNADEPFAGSAPIS